MDIPGAAILMVLHGSHQQKTPIIPLRRIHHAATKGSGVGRSVVRQHDSKRLVKRFKYQSIPGSYHVSPSWWF